MAKAEETKAQAPVKDDTPSMEEILQSIRGVISGEDADGGDVLELTEVVEEGMPAVEAPKLTEVVDNTKEKSILDEIDDALGTTDVAKPAPVEAEKPAEIAAAPEPVKEPVAEAPAAPPAPPPAPEPVAVKVEEKIEQKPSAKNSSPTSSEAAMTPEIDEDDDALEADFSDDVENIGKESSIPSTGRLLNEEVARKTAKPLRELVHSVHDKHVSSPHSRTGTSLEDLVIEAIKPFLADWLNKNLPAIVKKIVEKEVKHLIPKEEDDY